MSDRLHKILAHAGLGSRRDCEELVSQGRVSVDGKTVTELGTQVDPRRQTIKVDGKLVKAPPLAYHLLNKPRGVVCSAADDSREPRAIDLAPKGAGRLHTVGRLDKESEGLIILTNDGELTERLTHPRHDFPKTYHVGVRGQVHAETLQKLRKGIWLAEGKATVSMVHVLRSAPQATLLEVELREGKNREIRRIMARVGHPVQTLRRVAIGPIEIKGLGIGKTRPLSDDELELLQEAIGKGGPAEENKPKVKKKPSEQGRKKPKFAPAQPAGTPAAEPKVKGPATTPKKKKKTTTGGIEIVKAKKKDRAAPSDGPVADPIFPPEPSAAARPRYVPDEDGVIVVRRPTVRAAREEE